MVAARVSYWCVRPGQSARMAGVTLLGWRAQQPTPYSRHLPPSARSRNARPRRAQPLHLPREHRFHHAARRQYRAGGTAAVAAAAAASEGRPRSSGPRSLRALDRPPPVKPLPPPPKPPIEPAPPRANTRGQITLAPLALPRLATAATGPDSGGARKASPPESPGRSILSRGGVLPSTPRGLRPIGRRVELVEAPNVAPPPKPPPATMTPMKLAALPPKPASPASVSVNSQWGPKKSVRVAPVPQKSSDWFNSFGGRRTTTAQDSP